MRTLQRNVCCENRKPIYACKNRKQIYFYKSTPTNLRIQFYAYKSTSTNLRLQIYAYKSGTVLEWPDVGLRVQPELPGLWDAQPVEGRIRCVNSSSSKPTEGQVLPAGAGAVAQRVERVGVAAGRAWDM